MPYQSVSSNTSPDLEIQTFHLEGVNNSSWFKDKYKYTHSADKVKFYSPMLSNVWTSKWKSCHQVSQGVLSLFFFNKL